VLKIYIVHYRFSVLVIFDHP